MTLVCSDFEGRLLNGMFPEIDVELITFFYPDSDIKVQKDKLSANKLGGRRKNFVWLGNFMHRPNHEAARILIEDIWPRIKKEIPVSLDYKLDIYGSNFSQEIFNLCKGRSDIRCKVRSV